MNALGGVVPRLWKAAPEPLESGTAFRAAAEYGVVYAGAIIPAPQVPEAIPSA